MSSAVAEPAESEPVPPMHHVQHLPESGPRGYYDALVVGAGIMGCTLAGILARVQPDWRIGIVEQLDAPGLESSHAWNNAGTGHAGLCEFNYTPLGTDGTVQADGALAIHRQFESSTRYWAGLAAEGALGQPSEVIRTVPHYSYARGTDAVGHLAARHRALAAHPRFAHLEYSQDRAELERWLPAMFADRPENGEPVAVTRAVDGTDVDYGELAARLAGDAVTRGAELHLGHVVAGLTRLDTGWLLTSRPTGAGQRTATTTATAGFVFVAAGGASLPLLHRAGVPETRRYGGFPLSGQFLVTSEPGLVAGHRAKVYGRAEAGAPPISVPHLDLRVVEGRDHLLFGPFAAFSPRFLRAGRLTDLPGSVHAGNLWTMASAGVVHRDLVGYLLRQLQAGPEDRLMSLRRFLPTAEAADWRLATAGQRVQVVKPVGGRGAIAGFGTEVVTSAGGSLAALLGASPGASSSMAIVLEVLQTAFPGRWERWRDGLVDAGLVRELDVAGPAGASAGPEGGPGADANVWTDADAAEHRRIRALLGLTDG